MAPSGSGSTATRAAGRRATLAGLTGVAARGISVVALFASVPMALNALGEERFGLWMLITSLVASFGFMDLGIANGMLTAIARVSGDVDGRPVREIIATGVVTLAGIGAVVLLLGGLVVPLVDWSHLLKVSPGVNSAELQSAMLMLAALIAVGVPASSVQRIYYGLQRGTEANIWSAAGAIFGLAGVVMAVRGGGGLLTFVAASVGGPVLGWLLGGVALLIGPRALRPRPAVREARTAQALSLGRDGLLYFTLQSTAALAMYSDNAVLAAALGTADLASFSTAARVFGVISLMAGIMAYPLWAAFGLAEAHGDDAWIRHRFRKAMVQTIWLAFAASAILALAYRPLVDAWLGPGAPLASMRLILAFAAWTVVQSAGAVVAALMNALRAVRFQVVVALIFTPVCLLLKWLMAQRIGPEGIVMAATISYVVIALLPQAVYLRRRLAACRPVDPASARSL